MKRANGLIVLMALTLIFAGCNNYFHDLIPPDENRIVSFSVKGMIDRAVISDNAVDATVDNESPIEKLFPQIKISHKATLLPLTYEYLSAAFPSADILQESAAIYKERDLSAYVLDLIKRNPDFNVPRLDDISIDFTGPVSFLVVSGRGTIRQYTINVVKDTGEPRILGFGFSKYDNPELIRDASVSVNHGAKTVNAAVLYPMEMYVSYALVPSFEILGDKLEIDGVEIRSGVDAIQFTQDLLGAQTKTLTVWRNGVSADYVLTAEFAEDPDSIRSIIDFRFYKTTNPGIAATAVGSIANNNALGTINVQVFYSGTQPSTLTPTFLSPGTVSVAGVAQISGSTSHDFSQAIEYRVVSRNNLYTRIYTVIVDFIDVDDSAPIFTSFKFSSGLNHELVQDTESQISESASLIMITARYGGAYQPEMLIPEFRATGIVTVFGSVQTSGFSAQNFSIQIKYTVSNPENSMLKRDYWVQVTFIRDTSSAAQINSFSLHPDENPGLADEIEGRIDQVAGTITVFAPIGSGITNRTMFSRFRAAGQVLVNGVVQISADEQESGTRSGHLFNVPIVYEAVSANGANRKSYTVTVRELQSTIFVSQHAFGHGDGTSWADAFRELGAACEAAALFPEDVPKEIWIAAGTYQPQNYFLLAANTSYIGGFAGNEAAKSQRNVAANKTFVSAFDGDTAATINGDLSFENLEFTGAGIRAELSASYELRITNCDFSDIQATGAVYLSGGELAISSTSFEDIATEDYGAVFGEDLSAVRIDNVNLHNIDAVGLYFYNCSGDIEIDNVDLQDITNNGIHITSGNGRRDFNNITGNNVGGSYGVYVDEGSGDITLTNSDFDSRGIYFSSGGYPVRITQTTVKNISSDNGVYASGGTMVIENVVVEDVMNGTGMSLTVANNSALRISDSTIKNVKTPSGAGLAVSGTGSVMISNNAIENIETGISSGSAINVNMTGDLTIIDSAINTIVGRYGLYLRGSGNAVISNTTINNINAGSNGYAIYAFGRNLVIADTTMDNITAYAGVYGASLSGVKIDDLALRDIDYGLYFSGCDGDMEINGVNLQNISNDGIYVNGGSGKRDFSDIKGNNIGSIRGMYVWGGSSITLAESNFDASAGIYFYSNSASIKISDTEIKNVSSDNAIYTNGGNVVIERVTVENVPNGRGIYMSTSDSGRIIASIKNCTSSGNGGGISLGGSGNVTISGTTIEDIQANNGGGIAYSYSYPEPSGSLTISNTVIKNAIANRGGGLYYWGEALFVITDSRFENCRADDRNGAIYFYSHRNFSNEITNTTFLNCTARNGYKIMCPSGYSNNAVPIIFRGCTFEDNDALYRYEPLNSNYLNPMFSQWVNHYFENCTFTNLMDTYTGEQYIFTNYLRPDPPSGVSPSGGSDGFYYAIFLIRCTFNFRSGSAGLIAWSTGRWSGEVAPCDLLLDGVTINNNGGQQPLIWFDANFIPGSFKFKPNNIYNGTTLDTIQKVTGLGSGVVKLTNGAVPVLAP
jgi:hypothetical protein